MKPSSLLRRLIVVAAVVSATGPALSTSVVPLPSTTIESPITPVAVFGKDERVLLPAAHRHLRQHIGLLYEPRSRSICTAFCVAQDIVATAAHCLFRTSGEKPLSLSGMWFRLGIRNTRSHTRVAGAAAGTAAQNIMAGSMRLSVRPPIDATRDWALVRLARPVCTAGGLPLVERQTSEIEKLLAQRRVFQVAFHRDFRNWELAHSPCTGAHLDTVDRQSLSRDFTNSEHLLLHTCDSGGASSGSPLLINGPSGPEVIGINVGTYVQSKVLMQNDEIVRRFKPDEIANTGVSAGFIAPRLALFSKAQIITDRTRMRELQILLKRVGLLTGKDDGLYGPDLKLAIEAFERRERLAVTGLPTEPLLRQLGGSNLPPFWPARAAP